MVVMRTCWAIKLTIISLCMLKVMQDVIIGKESGHALLSSRIKNFESIVART
jgi:hypothetical protein